MKSFQRVEPGFSRLARHMLFCVVFLVATGARAQELSVPASAWASLNQAGGILTAAPKGWDIQVVFDPNCPYSALHYLKVQKAMPGVPMRWVPVAYYKKDSAAQVASMLAAEAPHQALAENFNGYDFDSQHGAWLADSPEAEPGIAQRRLKDGWKQWAGATPVTLIRDNQGRVRMFFGAMDNPQREAGFRAFIARHLGKEIAKPPMDRDVEQDG